MIIENFKDDKEALRAMTGELVRYMDRKDDGLPFNLALSGGGTAQKMFALWWMNIRIRSTGMRSVSFGSMNDVFRQLTRTVIMDMQTSFCSSRCIYRRSCAPHSWRSGTWYGSDALFACRERVSAPARAITLF